MPRVYAVGLAWVDELRSELVEDTDPRARFMAYGAGLEVPDRVAEMVDKKIRPIGDKQRAVPENKDAKLKPGLHTGGATKIAKGA